MGSHVHNATTPGDQICMNWVSLNFIFYLAVNIRQVGRVKYEMSYDCMNNLVLKIFTVK